MDRSEELLVRVEKKQQSGEASYGERATTWATQHEEEISRWRRPTFQKVGATGSEGRRLGPMCRQNQKGRGGVGVGGAVRMCKGSSTSAFKPPKKV